MELETDGFEKTQTSHKFHPHSQGYHHLRGKRVYQNDETNYEQKNSKRKFKGNKQSNEQSNTDNGKNTKISEIKDKENSKSLKKFISGKHSLGRKSPVESKRKE